MKLLIVFVAALLLGCSPEQEQAPEAIDPMPNEIDGLRSVHGSLTSRTETTDVSFGTVGAPESWEGVTIPVFVDGALASANSWMGRLTLPTAATKGKNKLRDLPDFKYEWRAPDGDPEASEQLCSTSTATNREGDPQCLVYVTRTVRGGADGFAGEIDVVEVGEPGGRIDVTVNVRAWTLEPEGRVCCGTFSVPIESDIEDDGSLLLRRAVLDAPKFQYCGFDTVADALSSDRCGEI